MNDLTEKELIELSNLDLKFKRAKYELNLALYRLFAPLLNLVVDGYLAFAEVITNAIESGNEIDARKIILGDTP